jgi:hypothetical protein
MSGTVIGVGSYSPIASANLPACSSAASDSDGDGYGWENNASCLVQSGGGSGGGTGGTSNASCIDTPPFDDDWGWDGSASCRLSASGGSAPTQDDAAECIDTPPFDDNWGWNGSASCMLDAGGDNSGGDAPTGGSGAGDDNGSECIDTPPFDDDWGWNGSASCRLSASGGTPTEPTTPTTPTTPTVPTVPTAPTPPSSPTGNITSSWTPVISQPADTCLTRQDTIDGNYHGAIRLGDFILATNAWNANAAGNFDWEQCIYANENGARVGWNYRWGAGGGPSDYNVRSYPELVYGVKSQGEISAPKSVTGLPVRIDEMPDIKIDYSLAGSEYGPARAVSVSTNPRFPNGTLIQGERNIAVESFLHPSDGSGNCGENVVQRGSGSSNHTYEVMVWIDSGAERLPSGPGDFVTTITLGGQAYDVYTKSSDRKYVAFVARNPQTSGVLDWSGFINWARQYAHRVQQEFGARVNSDQIQDDWCLANILIGTEIWWGDGDLNIYEWQINQN